MLLHGLVYWVCVVFVFLEGFLVCGGGGVWVGGMYRDF